MEAVGVFPSHLDTGGHLVGEVGLGRMVGDLLDGQEAGCERVLLGGGVRERLFSERSQVRHVVPPAVGQPGSVTVAKDVGHGSVIVGGQVHRVHGHGLGVLVVDAAVGDRMRPIPRGAPRDNVGAAVGRWWARVGLARGRTRGPARVTGGQSAPRGGGPPVLALDWGARLEHAGARNTARTSCEVLGEPL